MSHGSSHKSLPKPLLEARLALAGLALLLVAGLALGWNKGQLPRRSAVECMSGAKCTDSPMAIAPILLAGQQEVGCMSGAKCTAGDEAIAPDLLLYQQIISDVRAGRDYYDAAHERIPAAGFPITSPLNWRLPTYAWLLSLLPNRCWIQGVLLLIGVAGLWLTFAAERSQSSIGHALTTTLLMLGVFRWVLDGQAYLAQEVWAGVLLMLSTAALRLGQSSAKWKVAAIAAGVLALLFRELALPYCMVACTLALVRRRWWEAGLWGSGLTAFALLMVQHIARVNAELAEDGIAPGGGAGLGQWLRCGGLDQVLLTLRMNGLVYPWPAPLMWVYLLLALLGLAARKDDASRICCLAGLHYLAAFALIGRPENFYWGLIAAPLLVWGPAHAPAYLAQKWRQAAARQPAATAGCGPMKKPAAQ